MPIPHLESSKKTDGDHSRKARAAQRSGATPKTEKKSTKGFFSKFKRSKKSSDEKTDASEKRKPGLKGTIQHYWSKRWVRIISYILATLFILFIALIIAAFLWVSKDLADIADLENRAITQSTKIYASDGTTLLYELGDNKRQDVDIKDINSHIIDATLMLEDRRFYEHGGFDPIGLTRAVFSNITGIGVGGGASTLTQQFVKNAVLTNEQTFTRKAKEVILATRLEQKYSKDEILNMYLNEVYFGPNYQGVEAASQSYFNKSAKDVTLSEAAILASLPKNPVRYPRDPERLKTRRDYALDEMASAKKITEEERDAAKAEEVKVLNTTVTEIKAPHFVFYVIEKLDEEYGQVNVRKNGYKVITTLDWDKQEKAEKAIADGIGKVQQFGGSNASLVSIEAKTGKVLAMVGSKDYYDKDNDGEVNVATSLRQPGSSIKPLVYMTGFEKGLTPDTKVWNVETDFPTESGNYRPRNYSNNETGLIALRNALPQSLNIPAVKVLYLAGIDKVLDNAAKVGYTSLTDRKRYGLALTLGGGEVSLLEHTSAFAAFAREGERHKIAVINKVEDQSGKIVDEWKDESEQALNKDAVKILNSVLSDQGLRLGAFAKFGISGKTTAGKTGTTNDFRDAWAMGYTPSIATGVWTGNNDNSEMKSGADGSVIALPIWNSYMTAVLKDMPNEPFAKASWKNINDAVSGNIEKEEEKSFDKVTKELIPDSCLADYPKEFIEKKKVKEAHSILYYLNKDDFKASPRKNPADDPMFNNWEKAVQEYVKKNKPDEYIVTDDKDKKEVDCSIRSKEAQPAVTVTSLTEGESYLAADVTLAASVNPGKGRTIKTVEFFVDKKSVQTISPNAAGTKTITSSYKGKSLDTGSHTIKVVVTDDKENTAETSVKIKVVEKKVAPTPSTNSNTNSNSNSNSNSNTNTSTTTEEAPLTNETVTE